MWVEDVRGRAGVVHVRRLMRADEIAVIGEPRDIRGTIEADERIRATAVATGWSLEQLAAFWPAEMENYR